MSSRFARRLTLRICLPVVLALLSACGGLGVTKEPSAAALMPNLADYQVSDTANIQDAITKILGVASLGAGQPELAALVAAVNGLVSCYQKAGAIEGRTYVNKSDVSLAGVIVIVNRNSITDPNTFVNCVFPSGGPRTAVQACGKAYVLNKDNNQFYIGYAATSPQVCQTFCSALQGCTAP
jgi:hypothetical protein